jgi:hypothetical protein
MSSARTNITRLRGGTGFAANGFLEGYGTPFLLLRERSFEPSMTVIVLNFHEGV